MQQYLTQLLADIRFVTENVSWPFAEQVWHISDWKSDEEEDKTAPVRNLPEWTGIKQEMLPPGTFMNDEQITILLAALKKMLDAYNCVFVLQVPVPERIQYETIRFNFNQDVKVKQWHIGFFKLCIMGTLHGQCTLGQYCQCKFYDEFFEGLDDTELTPEEERSLQLQIEIKHIKRKYGEDWMKYYPYHLDANYDDEKGNPYNYGFDEDDDEDDDNWWRY